MSTNIAAFYLNKVHSFTTLLQAPYRIVILLTVLITERSIGLFYTFHMLSLAERFETGE